MSRALVVQYGCDAAACGVVVWLPVENNDPASLPGDLPGDWSGTARKQFCPKHAALVNAHVLIRPAETAAPTTAEPPPERSGARVGGEGE